MNIGRWYIVCFKHEHRMAYPFSSRETNAYMLLNFTHIYICNTHITGIYIYTYYGFIHTRTHTHTHIYIYIHMYIFIFIYNRLVMLFHALSHSKFAEFSQGDFLQSKRRCLVVHETFFCLANCTGVACWTSLGLSESEKNPWILRKMIHTTFHRFSRSCCWLFTGRQ